MHYAKEDFRNGSTRGLLNACGNAKRAIDSQSEYILKYLGCDSDSEKAKRCFNVDWFIGKTFNNESIDGQGSKTYRLIQSLGIAPTFLLTEVRSLRNRMEHQYTALSKKDVRQILELAELYINATSYKLFPDYSGWILSDVKNKDEELSIDQLEPAELRYILLEGKKSYFSIVTPYDKEFLPLLRLGFTQDYSLLIDIFNLPISEEHFDYSFYHI